jgi:hypothetical protein
VRLRQVRLERQQVVTHLHTGRDTRVLFASPRPTQPPPFPPLGRSDQVPSLSARRKTISNPSGSVCMPATWCYTHLPHSTTNIQTKFNFKTKHTFQREKVPLNDHYALSPNQTSAWALWRRLTSTLTRPKSESV